MSIDVGLDHLTLDSPEVIANPYPVYGRLQLEDPVHWDPGLRAWIVTRYADVVSGLRNSSLSARPDLSSLDRPETAPLYEHFSSWMLLSDPPAHTRLREFINVPLSPSAIARLAPAIRAAAKRLLENGRPSDRIDAVDDFAVPLAQAALAELFGVTPERIAPAVLWADKLLEFMATDPDSHAIQATMRTLAELRAFVDDLASTGSPDSDSLVGSLRRARLSGELQAHEAVAAVAQTLTGSFGALAQAIAGGLLAFTQDAAEARMLRENPRLVGPATEEVLRYDCPFLLVPRSSTRSIEICGRAIPPRQRIEFMLGAANHDPSRFAMPDAFQLTRPARRHLAFGVGNHYCPGAPFARLVVNIAFSTWFERFSAMDLQVVDRHDRLGMRGLRRLCLGVERTGDITQTTKPSRRE